MTDDQAPDVPAWEHRDDTLRRSVAFDGYRDAVAFVVRVALEAEAADHHPDLLLTWGRVDVTLTSHDVGGVTDRDVEMARTISRLVDESPGR